MVLMPKRKRVYRGIVIVDVACKLCARVVNCWLKRGVVLPDTLYGFREGRGMGKANLGAKLAQHLTGIAHEPLFLFFFDIRKAYYSLDRRQCIKY